MTRDELPTPVDRHQGNGKCKPFRPQNGQPKHFRREKHHTNKSANRREKRRDRFVGRWFVIDRLGSVRQLDLKHFQLLFDAIDETNQNASHWFRPSLLRELEKTIDTIVTSTVVSTSLTSRRPSQEMRERAKSTRFTSTPLLALSFSLCLCVAIIDSHLRIHSKARS